MSNSDSELTYDQASGNIGTIAGRLTLDANNDGTEANGSGGWDAGIGGRTVQLLDVSGNVVATTTTDAWGNYRFDVAAGQYVVKFTTSSGQAFATSDLGTYAAADSDAYADGTTAVINLGGGQSYLNIDASVVNTSTANAVTSTAITGDHPDMAKYTLGAELIVNGGFEAHANAGKTGYWFYDGLPGWSKIAGASAIELHTGNYSTGNKVGNAIVELDSQGGTVDGIKQTVSISETGTYRLSFDYGVRVNDYSGEQWWADSSSNSFMVKIDGKIVQLVGSGTDANFNMGFQTRSFDLKLTAGNHTIEFIEDGYDNAVANEGLGAELDNVSLKRVNLTYDTGIISGTFYYDGDRDGMQDANESGFAGRSVWLTDSSGNYIRTPDGGYVQVVTDVNGNYSFEGLKAGNYRVAFRDDMANVDFANSNATAPSGKPMWLSESLAVKPGMETGNVNGGMVGLTSSSTIKIYENDAFVKDFDTTCQIISEDVYFMVDQPICARIGNTSFGENQVNSWNNATTTAVDYYVFLEKPAATDLTFTVRITLDPAKVGSGAAPGGFAYLTTQSNEINAPRYEEITVTVKAGQTKSSAFYVGTEAAKYNYAFGVEIDEIYNHDQNAMCERVSVVVTTPVALDLNRDGKIGVTGDTTSANKAGLTIGETVKFDMNADGKAERIEWFDGSGDGILIDNRDGLAASNMNGSRLFGDGNGAYANGYAKLRAQFDTNGDGKISGAELNGLSLWVDDGDAKVEAGEIQTLKSHSITEISGIISTETDGSGRQIIRSTVKVDYETSGNVTYRLEGPDASLFKVDAQGKVSFIKAPDYEKPLDAGRDNVYNVTLVRQTDDPTCAPSRENLRIEVSDKPSLGDTVWYDSNGNGVLDSGEARASGVTVQLINAATGMVVATQTTNANGNYLFDDINPGNYQVKFVAPSGYTFTTPAPVGPEAANNDSDAGAGGLTGTINLVEGEHQRNVDAGLVLKDTGTASLGDKVWYDTNKDGVLNNGEAGASGVTVQLVNPANGTVLATTTTDANGNYLFNNLNAGNYQVKFVAPNGYVFTTQSTVAADAVNNDSDANTTTGLTGTVNLSIGEAERDVDAGLKDPGTASLGDTVWFDGNGNGVLDSGEARASGVTVQLINPANGAVLATQTTDANGGYLFNNLDAGNYQVRFVAPNGYTFTTQSAVAADAVNNDSDANPTTGLTGTVNLSIGEAERDVDAGLVLKDTGTASLGDKVWYDTNKDGVLNNGEAGAAGVTVQLVNPANGTVLATTTTDANGNYLFNNLNAGNYQVKFVAPNGYVFTTQSTVAADAVNNDSDANTTTGLTGTVNLSIGEAERDVDAGLKDPGTASLGDTVWFDGNGNGVLDSGEARASGVTVQLINPANGAVLATQTTDANGGYLFNNLDAGNYQVRFVAPNGYTFTTQSAVAADAVNNDSDANTTTGLTGTVNLSIGEAERDVDAGLVLKDTGTASLGDTVWYDTNKDGVLNNGEAGAAGVTVQLVNPANGAVLATTTTDANGNYLFNNLNAGNYQVKFVAPNGYVFTTQSTVAADAVNNDSDANTTTGLTGTVNLSIGEAERDVDAGLKDPGTASLGDTVWFDGNGNGVLDSGEARASGVTVQLINPANGAVLATQTTDANGGYLFNNLDAGNYQVRFVAPNGYTFTTQSAVAADAVNNDSDANPTTGLTGTVNLSIGEAERDVDAGLVKLNSGPDANDDLGKTCADESKTVNVLANDSDPDGDALTITAVNGQ
uniref:SdrD B-like domain-containing protein n=1 Tax=uncultured Paracoccus sp. TaxID=189685 RepID=UPI00263611AB